MGISMEINSTKYEDKLYEKQLRQTQENPTPQKLVQTEIQRDVIKGSSSLQKELLSIISANQEAKVQRTAKEQIKNGYLDVKV